jgi:hypothetical protein
MVVEDDYKSLHQAAVKENIDLIKYLLEKELAKTS